MAPESGSENISADTKECGVGGCESGLSFKIKFKFKFKLEFIEFVAIRSFLESRSGLIISNEAAASFCGESGVCSAFKGGAGSRVLALSVPMVYILFPAEKDEVHLFHFTH